MIRYGAHGATALDALEILCRTLRRDDREPDLSSLTVDTVTAHTLDGDGYAVHYRLEIETHLPEPPARKEARP